MVSSADTRPATVWYLTKNISYRIASQSHCVYRRMIKSTDEDDDYVGYDDHDDDNDDEYYYYYYYYYYY